MLASTNEYLQEAAETIFRMSADDLIRKRCREREEYYQDLRNYERAIAEKDEKIQRDRIEHEQDKRNYERKIEEDKRNYERQIEQLRAEIEALKAQNQQEI